VDTIKLAHAGRLQELTIALAPEGQRTPRACSPMRKPSGISAADTQAIAAVLEQAELLGDQVPKQVCASGQTACHWCLTAEPW
jgi:hypothetical protein